MRGTATNPPLFRRPFTRPQKPAINEVAYVEPTDGSLDLSEVVGRKVEVSFLLHDLLDNSKSNCNQFKALGIAGAAGRGKTTVCQVMFNSPEVREHFLPRIWVCMTKQPWDDQDRKVTVDEDMQSRQGEDEETIKKKRRDLVRKTVAERMLICLGEDEEIIKEREKDDISGLVSLLHCHLVGKRYLIVLDGACDADKWFNLGSDDSIQHKPDKGKNFTWVHSTDWGQSLGFGLPKGYGGAVIVNGRSDEVVEMIVGKENLHHLLPLSDKDCWAIFKKATVVEPECDSKVEELRRFVMKRAGGHPLMAKLLGQCYEDERVEKTTREAPDNRNITPGEESATQQANSSNGSSVVQATRPEASQMTAPHLFNSGNGSSIAHVTGPEASQVTAPPRATSSNGSSIAQVTGPEASQVAAPLPATSSNGSSIAQVTGPESAQVNAPPPANASNGSSIAQLTGPEASQDTTLQPVNSGNGSSIAQVTGPESAQVAPPPPANSSNRSSTAQVTGQDRPRLSHRNWSVVAMVRRWKNLLCQADRSHRTAGSR